MAIDKAKIIGNLQGIDTGVNIFQFDISTEHSVLGSASGSSTVTSLTSKDWTDFELANPKILYMHGEVTFTVTLTGASGHYDNGGSGRQVQFDGFMVMEFPLGTAPITSIDATNITAADGVFSWWLAGDS